MKKQLMALFLLLCLALAGCSVQEETDPVTDAGTTQAPTATQVPVTTEVPTETKAPAATEVPVATEAPAAEQAQAYLLVTVGDAVYEPIPLVAEGRYTIKRGDHINIVEVTAGSICMAESSCDNQDCVYQGVVDLENKNTRVLQNMIICLPNNVMLELYTYEELLVALPGWQGEQE